MKLVIGCLNAKYIHMSSAPWCLAAGLRSYAQSPVEYRVMDATVNGDLKAFAERIVAAAPKVASFSCYIWNMTAILQVCAQIKEQLDCTIILGGPEVAYRGAAVLEQYSFVDYVLAGEGEFAFPALVDALSGLGTPEQMPGLTWRQGDAIFSNPEACYTQTPPSPYNDEYFAVLGGRICYIESSRGCPYRCAFCLSGRVSPLRFFDLEQVKGDLLRLAQSGTKTVKFVDRTFNANEKHANELLLFIKERYGTAIPRGVCFHFEIAGDILRPSTLELLSQMPKGAVQLEIGMQSFNEPTLAAINRKTDTQKLIKNIRQLVGFGNMHIHIDLIAGLTGEGMAEFEKSFDTGYALGAHMLQMGFLKLLHGAAMREHPEEYPCEFSHEPPYEVLSTPWLTREEVRQLKKCEDALERLYNSGRFLFTLDYLLGKGGYTPFLLFFEFGNALKGEGMSLSDYAAAVYRYFAPRCDGELLREHLVCDLLSCSSALQIPPELKISDPRHKQLMSLLAKSPKTKVAILKKSGRIIAVDQMGERDLFGRYPGAFYPLAEYDPILNL